MSHLLVSSGSGIFLTSISTPVQKIHIWSFNSLFYKIEKNRKTHDCTYNLVETASPGRMKVLSYNVLCSY